MSRFLLFFVVLVTLDPQIAMSAANASDQGTKLPLPLDGIPNVVLKTRENSHYLPDRVIIKLMPGVREGLGSTGIGVTSIDEVLGRISTIRTEPMFPAGMANRQRSSVDLARFIVVRYTSPVDPFSAAEELSKLPEVQYAEPWFIYPLSYTPNDPSYSAQYGLAKIQAPAGWDITQGDTSIVIGIVDSGVQLAHPDLSGNIWHNPGELGTDTMGRDKRTNNTDDDGNGYTDDWQGWDFGGADYSNVVADNNPSPTGGNNAHGTHVAGIASASTDNGIGVAGTAFNCRILAIKTSADNDTRGPGGTGFIIAGIQGIAYAAALGADVMNCSWGGGGGSQVEQDIIHWANEQGTTIVAAAGNSSSSDPHYPSAYDGVISVAATGSTDQKSSYSNYGHTLDVSAPGDAVYSTYFSNSYAYLSGTSMASPHAAGAAALVKTMNPGFSALQVGEQLRVTSDDIDGINPSFTDLIGKGRVNILRALTEDPPSVRAMHLEISDEAGGNNNGNPEPGETIDLIFTFTNYLAPTTNAAVTLTETSAYLTVTNANFTVGSLGTLDTVRNSAQPFQISIAGNVPAGHIATLKMLISDGAYSDYQWFTLVVNPTFQSHTVNDLHVTMSNNGRIGYNDYPANMQGIGVHYPASSVNHIFEGGLIIGYSATKVVNNIRDNTQQNQEEDFLARSIYQLETPGSISNQDGYTWFSDSLAPVANRIGLRVDEYSYAFSSADDSDYVILRYDITNLTGAALTNVYVGQFYDWDIANYATNQTGFDEARDLAYAWDSMTPDAPYIGVRAFEGAASVRGIENSALTINRAVKWGWISEGTGQSEAGPEDVFFVISSGPLSIGSGETARLGFGIVGGSDLADLQLHSDAADMKWDDILMIVDAERPAEEIPASYSLHQNYPNPFNPATTITFELPEAAHVTLKVFSLVGEEIATIVKGETGAGVHSARFDASSLSSGVYFYRLQAGAFTATRKLMLVR